MTKYDSKILYEFADRLYDEANSIIWSYTTIGAIIGIVLGVITGFLVKNVPDENTGGVGFIVAIFASVILGVIGFYMGKEKAFSLKLKAQRILCMVKIEENTRK